MKLQPSSVLPVGVAFVLTAGLSGVAEARQQTSSPRQEVKQEAREAKQDTAAAARRSGNAITDSWITMKVHSQFVPEDALEDSDIDVTTKGGVVTLTGTVATAAGKSRAAAIAKATDGVKSVVDRLRVAPEQDRDATAAAGAAAREGARDTKDATRSAGRTVSDGWMTSKIYSQFIAEDALEDSDIDVDVDNGVVTLEGTVPTQAGSTRAAAIAKATDGVKSVRNNLKVGARR
jgi:hyperosmotically inducible protein